MTTFASLFQHGQNEKKIVFAVDRTNVFSYFRRKKRCMSDTHTDSGLAFARRADYLDPLAKFRMSFFDPDPHTIYLDGNSLGRLPHRTREYLQQTVEHQWGTRLIRSWNEGWYDLPAKLGAKLAPVIGAGEDEVIVSDSTSVNLFKAAWAALKHQSGRMRIVSDEMNFPTDLYILQGLAQQMGSKHELVLARSSDGMGISPDDLEKVLDNNTALVVLSHVAFKSAYMHDMEAVTELVHSYGALMLWDLSHSAGAVNIRLSEAGADLAIGCTYKYLNGGPGAPAYLYVNKNLHTKMQSPVWGWFGHDNPFAFDLEYQPAEGMIKFLAGTPPVLSMAAIGPGLDMVLKAGIGNIRKKSIKQTDYLMKRIRSRLEPYGFSPGTPEDPRRRGSHVSIRHPEAFRICQAMIFPNGNNLRIIPDFREPDNIRLGIAPLYNSFEELYLTVERIAEIVENKSYLDYSGERADVT